MQNLPKIGFQAEYRHWNRDGYRLGYPAEAGVAL